MIGHDGLLKTLKSEGNLTAMWVRHQEKITCLPMLLATTICYIGLHSNSRQVIFS